LIDPGHAAAGMDADRLAAALLVRIPPTSRVWALSRVAALPEQRHFVVSPVDRGDLE
jgi:hypothetical protein